MAYVLSLRPQSPLKRSFSDNPYIQSCSPLKDATFGALRDITFRNASACSLYSMESSKASEWIRRTENTPPPPTHRSLVDLTPGREGSYKQSGRTDHAPRKRSCGPNRPPPSFSPAGLPSGLYSKRLRDSKAPAVSLNGDPSSPESMIVDSATDDDADLFDLYEAIHIPLPKGSWPEDTSSEPQEESKESPVSIVISPQPFRRWMSTIRRRHGQRRKDFVSETSPLEMQMIQDDGVFLSPCHPTTQTVRRISSSMSSSLGCVTAIKTASITIASASIAPHSDLGGIQGKVHLGNRSSNYSDARRSTESHGGALGPIIDESAWLRSVQRRKIVEELISSEESYIADLKVLINVCFWHQLLNRYGR